MNLYHSNSTSIKLDKEFLNKAKYFKVPRTVNGYIPPDDLLEEYRYKLKNRV